MAFKIADAFVSVKPDDTGFEDDLRAKVEAAAEGVAARVGVELHDDTDITLAEDVRLALDAATLDVRGQVGLGLKDDSLTVLEGEIKAAADLASMDAKIKVGIDPKSAADTQGGISSMMIAAITAGAAFGPAAILAAASVVTVGLGALVVKSNRDIGAEYQKLAGDVGSSLKGATAPLVPAVQASLVQVDGAVRQLTPTLDTLFKGVEPDLYVFTTGVTGLAEQFLPRFTQAVDNSRGIVTDFSQGLPALGAGLGNMFMGLTTGSVSTGRAFQDLEVTLGTTLGTAGQLIGSFSASASSYLQAILPAADGVLTVIGKLASPETIGAAGGAFAVKQWGSGIQSGLQSVSNAFTNVAAKADGAGGLVGKAGSAAESAAGGFGTMADVMGGPWGIAVGAGVGLLGGFVSSIEQSTVSASDFTAAIAQDAGAVGANTETVIQQTIAKQNLSDLNDQLGTSTSTLIAYAAGDKSAQEQVTAAYQAKEDALNTASSAQGAHNRAEEEGGNAADHQAQALANAKTRLDQVTSAIAQAVAQQNEQTASLNAAEKATDVFTQQVNAQKLALQSAAQTALVNATALNESLPVQGELTTSAITASLAYQQEANATSAYTSALTALYGEYGDTSAAQAAFTTSVVNLKGQITKGKDAVDANTAAGAKNITAFSGAAKAAETYSEKLYQQTGSADQANQSLRTSVQRLDDAATHAGLTKTQVQQLNTELFGVPNVKDIKIALDDTHALGTLNQLIDKINTSVGTVQVYAYTNGSVGNIKGNLATHAAGGTSFAGIPEIVGDGGRPEVFVPKTDGYVYPSVAAGQQAIVQHNAQVAARSTPPAATGGIVGGLRPVTVEQHFHGSALPTIEERANLNRELALTLGAY